MLEETTNRVLVTRLPKPELIRDVSFNNTKVQPENNHVECIEALMNIFSKYFIHFYSHTDTLDINNRSLYSAPNYSSSSSVFVVKTQLKLPVLHNFNGNYGLFFLIDNKILHYSHEMDVIEKKKVYATDTEVSSGYHYYSKQVIEIVLPVHVRDYVRDFTIGYYVLDRESLLTTDWCHTEDAVNFIDKYVKNALITELPLKRIPIPRMRLMQPIPIKLGCDPEFEVVKTETGYVTSAAEFATLRAGFRNYNGGIGRDGSGKQLELRPRPGNPKQVTTNMKVLFNKLRQFPDTKNTDILVSGHTFSLGGHIHFGVKRRLSSSQVREFAMLCDDFLGKYTLELSGYARSSFKVLSAVRDQKHGFEYRTPPSIIFYSPAIAEIVLTLVQNLADKYFNSKVKILYATPVTIKDLVTVGGLTEAQAKTLQKTFTELKRRINNREVIKIDDSWWLESKELAKPQAEDGPSAERVTLRILFVDDWETTIRTEFFNLLSTILQQKVFTANVTQSWTLSLFGMKESRGPVSNIMLIDEWWVDSVRAFHHTDKPLMINVGLPFLFRTNREYFDGFKTRVADSVMDKVEYQIQNRL